MFSAHSLCLLERNWNILYWWLHHGTKRAHNIIPIRYAPTCWFELRLNFFRCNEESSTKVLSVITFFLQMIRLMLQMIRLTQCCALAFFQNSSRKLNSSNALVEKRTFQKILLENIPSTNSLDSAGEVSSNRWTTVGEMQRWKRSKRKISIVHNAKAEK